MSSAEEVFKARMAKYLESRDDLMTPSKLNAAYTISDLGTDLEAIEPFTAELTGIVDTMKERLASETRILEGTEVPVYVQNELSGSETKEGQWTTDLQNGFSTTVLIPTSTPASSSSSCSARPNSPVSGTPACEGKFCERSTPSSWVMSGACGCATAATNESSVCTVPMTSAPTPGTPSEEK